MRRPGRFRSLVRPCAQWNNASAVLDVAKLLWDTQTLEGKPSAGSSCKVLLAAVDFALTLLRDLHRASTSASSRAAGTPYGNLQVNTLAMLQHLSGRLTGRDKPAVAAGLLQEARLRLWWGCVECLRGGQVGQLVVTLLLLAVTKAGPRGREGGSTPALGISAQEAGKVRLRHVPSCVERCGLGAAPSCAQL
jgi:hypothetical protein